MLEAGHRDDMTIRMADEIQIRTIHEADFAAYKALRLEGLRSHPEAFGSDHDEQANDPDSVWLNRIRASVLGRDARLFLADAGSELAGMVAVFRDSGAKVRHSANIVSVYVRLKWRGRRLSELMIGEAIKWSAGVGIRILRLTASAGNGAAIGCYLRCGFRVCGVQPEVIRVGEVYHDEVLMWRRVGG
jgi:RimJ/RimL family protein N-acetyltransferase